MSQNTSQKGLVPLKASIPTPNPCRALAQVQKTMRHKRIYPVRDTRACVSAWCGLYVGSSFVPRGFGHINREGRVSPSVHSAPECVATQTHVKRQGSADQDRTRRRNRRVCPGQNRTATQAYDGRRDYRAQAKARQLRRTKCRIPVAFDRRGDLAFLPESHNVSSIAPAHGSPCGRRGIAVRQPEM